MPHLDLDHYGLPFGVGTIVLGAAMELAPRFPSSLSTGCLLIGTACTIAVTYTRLDDWWQRRKERTRGLR